MLDASSSMPRSATKVLSIAVCFGIYFPNTAPSNWGLYGQHPAVFGCAGDNCRDWKQPSAKSSKECPLNFLVNSKSVL